MSRRAYSEIERRMASVGGWAACRRILDDLHVRAADDVLGPSKRRAIARARGEMMAWVRRHCPEMSLADIGEMFGRDGSTVAHAVRRVESHESIDRVRARNAIAADAR